MANYSNLLATIAANIYTNGNNEVTAAMVKAAADSIVSTISGGYIYAGIAHPADASVTPDANCFWIASEAGTYTNKGGITVASGEVAILKYNGTWSKEVTGAATSAQLLDMSHRVLNHSNYAYLGLSLETRLPGTIEASTGAVYPGANNFYIKVPLVGIKSISVPMFLTSGDYGLAFFDDEDRYISGEKNTTDPQGTLKKYSVPSGTAYMLYSYLTDTYCDTNNLPRFYGIGLEYDFDRLYQDIQGIYGKSFVTRLDVDQSQFGTANASTGDIEGTTNPNLFYKIIDVTGVWKVNCQVFKSLGGYGFAFLDENDDYISGYTNPTLDTGTRQDIAVPEGAKSMIYSYITDTNAVANTLPKFDYVALYSTEEESISGLLAMVTERKRPRPASGAESFNVTINATLAELDTDNTIGDTLDPVVDYGIIQLPTNYSPDGKPVPLAIVCHGSGAQLSQYKNPVVVDGKAMGDPSKYLVQKGYACMDMFGLPEAIGGGSELHIGNPRTLLCYLAGYEYVKKHYNVEQEKVFVSGSSMGGLSSFQIVQSGLFPVAAQAGFAPVIDLFKQPFCDPWRAEVRPSLAQYFGFEGTVPTWTFQADTPPTQDEIDYFLANYEKIVGFNPIANILVAGDYKDTFDYIPVNLTAVSDPTEKAIYDNFRAVHPVPLKIWHCKNDTSVAFRYSAYMIDMLRKSGRIAFLRPFESGGHNAWDAGNVFTDVDIDGATITTHVAERECFLWFERFR